MVAFVLSDTASPAAIHACDFAGGTSLLCSSFGSIAYEKGGSVLRMLRAYLNRGRVSNLRKTPSQPLRRLLIDEMPGVGGAAADQGDVFMKAMSKYLK